MAYWKKVLWGIGAILAIPFLPLFIIGACAEFIYKDSL